MTNTLPSDMVAVAWGSAAGSQHADVQSADGLARHTCMVACNQTPCMPCITTLTRTPPCQERLGLAVTS